MRLALDNHYSPMIAEQLRGRSHDAVAAVERGWEREDDERLLALCAEEARALLTNNVRDFVVITRSWAMQGSDHHGLIYTSDAGMPRSRDRIGRYVEALDGVLRSHPETDDLRTRVLWL